MAKLRLSFACALYDRMQPLYFVSDGVEEVASAICGLHPADLAALAG